MKCKLAIVTLLFSIVSLAQRDEIGSIKTEIVQKRELTFALHIPKNTKEKKPLIIFLHGSGEKGTDIGKVKAHGPFKYLKSHDLDAYVLAPQCPENEYWNEEVLYRLILKIQKENNIDSNRIYLTGLSMGAWGAWNLVFAHPETFAAFVPIAGYVDRIPMIENCKIAAIPTRIFHGLLDDVVNVEYSIAMYKKLKTCNTNVALTIFDDANHDSWTRVYDNQEIYDWMFKQTKNRQNEN
ncbi:MULTISPECIES: prolyl oligopeptidase family serine peptidase [unclassified Flavobacterium]|uniref:carboxylesterase family protein n=1 Tax=unclassified Flavobacterium TaxID=196869 RepID=UPI000C173B59|nr:MULTISPECIES: prolyl oligopeptidase family serine peptidase [unclassified Flavobacterium]PIF62453.1 phospholipase/carboxylesterase [Flavobacterium sp. 11]WKL43597.1 prolyl oligopeptidase family serine peptidase [Flavobacterium sp. ZE23DGlu08]